MKVKQVISEVMHVELNELTDEMYFAEDLGTDSLDIIEMIVKFEKAFNINIPDEEIDNIQTVGQAITYIQNNINEPT